MTSGFFTADREPSLSLEVRGPNGARSFDAVINTGFNGGLTLPPDWIDELRLPQVGEEPLVLADGRQTVTRVYRAYAILDEAAHDTSVAEAPTPLIGTDLLWGFSLYIEFQASGAVEIARLPEDAK